MHLYTKYLLRPSCLSLAQAIDGVEAAIMRSPAVSVIPAIIHLHSKYGLCEVRGLSCHLEDTVLHTEEVVRLS